MTPEQFDEKLKNYRSNKARCAYLRHQIESLNRWMRICKGEQVLDMMSMSQALTGMPHGSGVGDPTGRLAMDIASGKTSHFVKEIQEELIPIQDELEARKGDVTVVEIVLTALTEIEREVVTWKALDWMEWADVLRKMNEAHSNAYAKRSLQRIYDRALEKAYAIVA